MFYGDYFLTAARYTTQSKLATRKTTIYDMRTVITIVKNAINPGTIVTSRVKW